MKTRKIILGIIILILLTAGFFYLRGKQANEQTYQNAVHLAENGDPEQAYRMFRQLIGYRDSDAHAAELLARYPVLAYSTAEKGSIVSFGSWDQDGDETNGTEPIEWVILDRIDDQILLLAASGLEAKAYNDTPFEPTTWETCTLRAWLRNEFMNSAFTEPETSMIAVITNHNPDHSTVKTPGGNDTDDSVFLLSEIEAKVYFNDEMDREMTGRAPATATAQKHGVQVNEEGYASWWLRSPGNYEYSAQFVDESGSVYLSGALADITDLFAIRPALWLNVDITQ